MKLICFLFISVGLLNSRLSSAASFEFVSPEQRSSLAQEFQLAHSPKSTELNKSWNCDMYGMRSHLQVERNISLYKFDLKASKFINQGSHVVHDYQLSTKALVGSTSTLIDQVKITDKGTLIAQLSTKTPEKIVAYSKCTSP